ncbi:MAG: hypothetical protein HC905_14105 [Bacteroidales bacterium]|nr:hypothetical protein [Bacteroidales bacterium]
MELEDYRGCIGTDSIAVYQSESSLKAQFLMASAINLNDTLIIFESSDPLPDSISVTWTQGLKEIASERYYKNLVPTDTGKVELTLISYLNGCQDIISKTLMVLPPVTKENENQLFKESIIRLFKIYPNPTEGEFQAEVNLSEDSDITLRLVSFGTGKQKPSGC